MNEFLKKYKFVVLILAGLALVFLSINLYRIYFGGEKVCIDGGCKYLKNKFNVYHRVVSYVASEDGSKFYRIPNANPKNFEILENNYSKDGKSVFSCHYAGEGVFGRNCKKINKADVDTFEVLELEDDYFAKDKNNVYCRGNVTNFDNSSFNIEFGYNYFKDKYNVYFTHSTYSCNFEKIEDVDINSFEVFNFYKDEEKFFCRLAKDNNNLYYNGKKIDNLDLKTLKILDSDCDYFKDKNNVFNGEKTINVNIETFEVLDSIHSRDKNNCYEYRRVVPMSECDKIENQK
jgi:hypothetical protein